MERGRGGRWEKLNMGSAKLHKKWANMPLNGFYWVITTTNFTLPTRRI